MAPVFTSYFTSFNERQPRYLLHERGKGLEGFET